jgi:uncharacterized protein (TIGR03435 family)
MKLTIELFRVIVSGKRWYTAACIACIVACAAFGQPSAVATSPGASTTTLRFDVVAIHRNISGGPKMSRQTDANTDGITMTNVPLFMMLYYAFRVNDESLISGFPDWTMAERYDITAKVAAADVAAYQKLTKEQRSSMFLSLLEERFALKAHRETRDKPVYALEVAKGGPHMKAAPAAEKYAPLASGNGFAHGGTIFTTGPNEYTAQGATMAELATTLSNIGHEALGRPVVDWTGLTGKYDFTLRLALAPAGENDPAAGASLGSAIQDAVQDQLGLKLAPGTAPTSYVVVDHIERPSGN